MHDFAECSDGRRIFVDIGDPRGKGLIEADGDLNPFSSRLWREALRLADWNTVIDVGVNYGEMLSREWIPDRARLIGFEPNLALHPFILRTAEENKISLDLRSEAVAAEAGERLFRVDLQWSGTSGLVDRHGSSDGEVLKRVSTTTLAAVLGTPPGSFCVKVDVEGFEHEVMAGLGDLLAVSRPWAIMLEVAHMNRLFVAALAERYPMVLQDKRTPLFVRVPGGNAEQASLMIESRFLHGHDCLLMSEDLADLVIEGAAQ